MVDERLKDFFLAYIRKHPGTVEVSHLVYDIVCHQGREECVTTISALLRANGERVHELLSSNVRQAVREPGDG